MPDRDAGADEYERQLKAKLNEAKEKAGPAPNKNGPVLMVENKPLSPDQHDQQMKKPRPPKMENRDLQKDGDGDETDDSDYVGEVNALHMEDDVAHEEEPEEKEMAGEEEGVDNSNRTSHLEDDATEDEQEKEMAGGEEGMDNSNRASHIEDDATEEELEADAERKEQERLAAAAEEAAKQAELEEAARKKAAGEADQEDGQPVSEDEQPVSEPASEVDDEKPAEMNGKPAPEPPVVETKEKPAPEPPVVEPKKVKDDTTASSAAAATKVGTEIQAEATGGCCVIL